MAEQIKNIFLEPFAFSSLLAFITSIALGLLVLIKSTNKKLGQIWFLFSVMVAVWGLGGMGIGIAKTPSASLLSWRLSFMLGVTWIPVVFYHFTCIFCEIKRPRTILAQYIIGALFLPFIPTSLFFADIRWSFNSMYYTRAGPALVAFTVWWFYLVFHSHLELYLAQKNGTSFKKNQIRHFFVASAFGFGGGGLDFLPTLGVNFYPWGNFTIFLYPFMMSYAILKYRLMDIRIVIRRAALLILIYTVLVLSLIPWVLWTHKNMMSLHSISPFLIGVEIIFMSGILSLGPLFYAYFVRSSTFFREDTLAGLTHELKTPLAAIEGALEVLAESHHPKKMGSKRLEEYLTIIRQNSSRLNTHVNNLLHVYKNKISESEITKEPANLKNHVKKTAQSAKSSVLAKGNSISIKWATPLSNCHCDPDKIEQVLSNLISNGNKFTNKGKIQIEGKNQEDQFFISIKDTGIGIKEEEIPHIFNRFYRGKNNTQLQGTGLGLAIAKKWVEAHGGEIWAESDGEGKGTTMTFTLPAK